MSSVALTVEDKVEIECAKGAVAHIDLSALKHNYQHAKSLAPTSRTMAVIKANAYGHGMVSVAAALCDGGVDGIAVAQIAEGVELRKSGINIDHLLILQGARDDKTWDLARKHHLTVMVHNEQQIKYVLSDNWPASMPVWVKVDTGMHRVGLTPEFCERNLGQVVEKFSKDGFVLCSHFACSDEVDLPFNMEQVDIIKGLQEKFDVPWSIANSGGILSMPKSHGTWNRAGYMLYGNSPLATAHPAADALKPVMSLTAPIVAVKDVAKGESVGYSRRYVVTTDEPRRIATVAMGYGDGYPRHARTGTPVLVAAQGGTYQEAFLAGNVSMDMITIDVTDVSVDVVVGDEVCVWGDGKLSVNRVAEYADTIGYELLTKLTSRPRKNYTGIA